MNPHFIFNTLNSIQGLIAMEDRKTAREQLSRFSSLMRSTLENVREELIPLSEELEACEKYASLERVARGLDFDFDLQFEFDEDPWIPPLILQPFVENCIVHGLVPSTQKGKISILCTREGHSLVIRIEDNGVGRSFKKKNETHKSLGTSVTSERLSSGIRSGSIAFIDLKHPDGTASGTAVRITINHAFDDI
jgi:sensor histidine kinase YesM